jgi:hypothetical protein
MAVAHQVQEQVQDLRLHRDQGGSLLELAEVRVGRVLLEPNGTFALLSYCGEPDSPATPALPALLRAGKSRYKRGSKATP